MGEIGDEAVCCDAALSLSGWMECIVSASSICTVWYTYSMIYVQYKCTYSVSQNHVPDLLLRVTVHRLTGPLFLPDVRSSVIDPP